MRSTSIFPCIMTVISNFTIFLIFQIFIFKFFFINITDFCISYYSCCSFVNNFFFFFKLVIFIVCCLKNAQNFIMQSLPQYTSCLFSLLLIDDIVDIEKPDGIYLLTFDVDEFSLLFLYPSIFSL